MSLALIFALSVSAQSPRDTESRARNATTPIRLIGVIPIPGNPLVTSDIIWVDPGTRRLYVTDRSNFGIDIFDAINDVFVGRVTGFAGPEISRGDPNANATVPPPNGEGPSGVLVTPNKKVWAGDGNSTVKVADVDPASPNYLKIIQSISTAIPECGSHCDRADEIGYDPADHIIAVANNQPLTAAPTTPPTRGNPYATFINADTYQVLGHITFEGATGLEQPLWVPEQRRFFITVTGYRNNGGSNGGFGELAVIDPKSMKVEKSLNPGKCHPSAEALGPSQHVLVSCGAPVVLSATDGTIISTITQIGGGDENWYNPGRPVLFHGKRQEHSARGFAGRGRCADGRLAAERARSGRPASGRPGGEQSHIHARSSHGRDGQGSVERQDHVRAVRLQGHRVHRGLRSRRGRRSGSDGERRAARAPCTAAFRGSLLRRSDSPQSAASTAVARGRTRRFRRTEVEQLRSRPGGHHDVLG